MEVSFSLGHKKPPDHTGNRPPADTIKARPHMYGFVVWIWRYGFRLWSHKDLLATRAGTVAHFTNASLEPMKIYRFQLLHMEGASPNPHIYAIMPKIKVNSKQL